MVPLEPRLPTEGKQGRRPARCVRASKAALNQGMFADTAVAWSQRLSEQHPIWGELAAAPASEQGSPGPQPAMQIVPGDNITRAPQTSMPNPQPEAVQAPAGQRGVLASRGHAGRRGKPYLALHSQRSDGRSLHPRRPAPCRGRSSAGPCSCEPSAPRSSPRSAEQRQQGAMKRQRAASQHPNERGFQPHSRSRVRGRASPPREAAQPPVIITLGPVLHSPGPWVERGLAH